MGKPNTNALGRFSVAALLPFLRTPIALDFSSVGILSGALLLWRPPPAAGIFSLTIQRQNCLLAGVMPTLRSGTLFGAGSFRFGFLGGSPAVQFEIDARFEERDTLALEQFPLQRRDWLADQKLPAVLAPPRKCRALANAP
jgi:hypothetical protein